MNTTTSSSAAPRRPRRARSGFTLLELLVVILMICVLMGAAAGAFLLARNIAWKHKARDTARQIVIAWNLRLMDIGFPPVAQFDPDPRWNNDADSITFESTVTNMLFLVTTNRTFLEQSMDERANGMRDRWGHYFHVRLDLHSDESHDGTMLNPVDDRPVRANVLVWSEGPHPEDRVKSWIVLYQ
jgi:prepilin-type N-terminal cleavage/methylation domain-containing protein